MVAAFLRAEIDADRWAPTVLLPRLAVRGWPESLLRTPDLTDADANSKRAELLGEARGWQRGTFLFVGFPPAVDWHRAELDPDDVGDVLGANYPTWVHLSGGSRRVADSAAAAGLGPLLRDLDVLDAAIRAHWIARRYRSGEALERPILVAPESGRPIIAIEGHTRLIGWILAGRQEPLSVIIGLSDRIAEWHWY